MYSQLPADIRGQHPFHMYDEIMAQPEAVANSLRIVNEQGSRVLRFIAGARRVFVVGCGTSFHGAQGGAALLNSFSKGHIDARAVQAYEFVTYFSGLRPDDIVIGVSHSATTFMTLEALKRAGTAGAETVLVTGFPGNSGASAAAHVLATGYGEERSWAHTISYLAALATFAGLANALADDKERLDLTDLPPLIRDALQCEEIAHRIAAGAIIAERHREPSRIVLAGGGPNSTTAFEGALKLLETTYMVARAFELEELLHGPLAAVDPDCLLVVLAPPGESIERAEELVRAARKIGLAPVVITGAGTEKLFDDTHRLVLADVPEVLSPLSYVVPLQFLSYFLAIGKGLNPDLIHRDDQRYLQAAGEYR